MTPSNMACSLSIEVLLTGHYKDGWSLSLQVNSIYFHIWHIVHLILSFENRQVNYFDNLLHHITNRE